jgi:hypothetical protein
MSLPKRGIMSATSSQARTAASRHLKYWARLRTDLALCERSERVSGTSLALIKAEAEKIAEAGLPDTHYLGLLNVSYPHELRRLGLEPEQTYSERKEVLGVKSLPPDVTPETAKLDQWLRTNTKAYQASTWNFRAGEASRFYSDLGWYPFFVTLTVDPKMVDPLWLWKEGRGWQRYVERLARLSKKARGCSRWEVKNTSNHHDIAYFGNLEHGKSGHHHHMHALIWLREVPEHYKDDPNGHLKAHEATKRRCYPLEAHWKYSAPSQRPAIYYWHADCVWQHMGHKIPIDEKTGVGLKLMNPEFTGGYLSKYMAKEDKPWHHEVKATRGLGLERVTRLIKQTSTKGLVQLARFKEPSLSHLVSTTISVPHGLLRSLAKTEIYYRSYLSMEFLQLIEPKPKPYGAMLKSVKDGQLPWRMRSEAFSRWLQHVLPEETNEYCEETFFHAFTPFYDTYRLKNVPVSTLGGIS